MPGSGRPNTYLVTSSDNMSFFIRRVIMSPGYEDYFIPMFNTFTLTYFYSNTMQLLSNIHHQEFPYTGTDLQVGTP